MPPKTKQTFLSKYKLDFFWVTVFHEVKRKIKTDQRKLMGDKLLESLVVLKHIPIEALSQNDSTES